MKQIQSKLLSRLIKNLEVIEKDYHKEVARVTKRVIKTGKDVNYTPFIKPKAGNKPLQRTGSLFKSIRSTKNGLFMNKYGRYLDSGTNKMAPREFIPKENTKVFQRMMNKLIKKIVGE